MTDALVSQQEDHVLLLEDVPRPAADAAEPFVVSSARRLILAYPITEADFDRFGPFDAEDDPYCTVLFPDAVFYRLGPPGGEELALHPLASRGLAPDSVHEIINSSLTAELAELAAQAVAVDSPAQRHFVIAFQDVTFECVASDYTVVGVFGAGEIASREAFALVR